MNLGLPNQIAAPNRRLRWGRVPWSFGTLTSQGLAAGGSLGLMKTLSLLLTLGIVLFAFGCGGMFKGKKAAEQSVADFHKLYNDGKLAEIYSAGHSKFKG